MEGPGGFWIVSWLLAILLVCYSAKIGITKSLVELSTRRGTSFLPIENVGRLFVEWIIIREGRRRRLRIGLI